MQRLRRISQTSLVQQVYPSATGARFAHAIGTAHLAQRSWSALLHRSRQDDVKNLIEQVRLWLGVDVGESTLTELLNDAMASAALLHDVGHAPFSHALEGALAPLLEPHAAGTSAGKLHERLGRAISERILADIDMSARYRQIVTPSSVISHEGLMPSKLTAVD